MENLQKTPDTGIMKVSTPAIKIGVWSALLLAVQTVAFGIALLFPTANIAAYLASFLIAPTFVVLMVAVHHVAPPDRRVWSQLGMSFAVIYATLGALNYYVQLTFVRTNSLGVSPELLSVFSFTPGSFMFAQDMLGYAFLCLATLTAAPVFASDRLAAWIKRLFIIHGLVLFVPLVFPALTFAEDSTGDEIGVLANLFWCILFAPIALLLVVYFKRLLKSDNLPEVP